MVREVSVVLPVYNEEQNLPVVVNELVQELNTTRFDYELIFVDDGSKDHSYQRLQELAAQNKKIKIVKLISNYGQSTALAAGIDLAEGRYIVTMDCDGQHDPKDILTLVEPLRNGYQVVCGWRKDRQGSVSLVGKTLPSRFSNFLIRTLLGVRLHDTTGGMRAFTREVAESVPLYGEMHRYLPLLARWKGFKITERPIHIRRRKFGQTKYNVTRLFRGFFDLVTVKFFISYSTRPFHIFATVGLISFALGFLIGVYYLIQKFFFDVHLMTEVASLILSVLLILLGVNFICFGFIADMISFDAIASKKRKMYVVEKILN